jgi:hypothetical protein
MPGVSDYFELTRWLHPAPAGRGASSPWIRSSMTAPITNRTCCLDNKNLIAPRSPGEGTG